MAHASTKSQTTWDEIQSEIRKSVPASSYNAWLRSSRQERFADGTLVVSVTAPDPAKVGEKFGPQIEQAIRRLHLGDNVRAVVFVPPAGAREIAPTPPPNAEVQQLPIDFERVPSLQRALTFETFVVGKANEFAHAAALGTAERPGRAYNPLFLYGGVGLGKTHLMHAIGHRSKKLQPHLRIEYVTAETFTNELIGALRNPGLRAESMAGFRERYRSIDVLLIDDIQFISNKESTQEEFFHTFNTLHAAGKQIVISSDRVPKELTQLEDRLRSRFEWGLTTDLQPPDLETRIAILMQKAQRDRQQHPATPELNAEVADFIASKIKSNIRELEGALTRLVAYCSLKGMAITVASAQEALRNVLDQQQRKLDIEIIAKVVADAFNLKVADLKLRNNSKHIVFPRQVAMYLTKRLIDVSLPELARFYGGKHHSTVIHSIRKIERERQGNAMLQRTLLNLQEKLN